MDATPQTEHWRFIRRSNLMMMRKQVRSVVLLMALMEAMRVGPMQLIFAGKEGYPAKGEDDFGIAYTMGYVVSYLYVCIFTLVWVPLFSWWVPKNLDDNSTSGKVLKKTSDILKKINMVLLPISIALCLAQYVFHLAHTFIYVDSHDAGSRALPKNTKKNWMTRLMLLAGVLVSLSFGYYAFGMLGHVGLARVKMCEYLVIVVPVQINIGLLLGTIGQFKMEQRMKRKEEARKMLAKMEGEVGEKVPLMEV